MSLTDYIITVFCLIDDMLAEMKDDGLNLRRRGPAPQLADSVVLAREIIGEFLGYDTDSGIFHYFRRHHVAFFRNSCRCIARPSPERPPTFGESNSACISGCCAA
ncbi:hypothetical protein AWN76_009160 [Rhodothermaceae bacterium RA]|nr:hypothetical protein AWN76_009160 [Rhodothermaceae bacterium RA]